QIMSDYWSQYWRQGHLTSFGEDIADNYEGSLKNVWQGLFTGFNAQDRVLDIGTGNGALVSLIHNELEVANYPYISAVDLAEINVNQDVKDKSSKTEFIDYTNCEQLPFAQQSFSYVISQFGIEYSKLSLSLAQIAKVLKIGGKCQFVCHHPDSIIVKPNVAILKASIDLRSSKGGFTLLQELLVELYKNGRGSPKSEKLRAKLNKYIGTNIEKNNEAFQATNFPLLVKTIFQQMNDKLLQQKIIAQFKQELAGSIERLSDLSRAALSKDKLNTIKACCSKLGLEIENISTVYDEQDQILATKINLISNN
ncbi:MAG: methyltransferase domain-containing protein, partial [Thalassotalea sp.]|nr:methyltransferase domain-containing protein [Thalassotalea sp.]